MDALNKWLVAESQLKTAASNFLDACTVLQSAISHPLPSYSVRVSLEEILIKVQSRIESIESADIHRVESRAVLNGLLNLSRTLVPINRLPPETLGHIFAIVVSYSPCTPTREQRDSLLDIPLVCTRWHRIISSIPSIWSHVDFHTGITSRENDPPFLERTRLWLERAQGAALHLHFRSPSYIMQEDLTTQTISLLQPHANRLSSIYIDDGYHLTFIRAILELRPDDVSPSSLKNLILSGVYYHFRPVHLSFWPGTPFRGLVDLQLIDLEESMVCPTLAELAITLSHSPSLQTLRLLRVGISSVGADHLPPISLPGLRLLDLTDLEESILLQLVQVLSPGNLQLDVRLNVCVDDATAVAVRSLFKRSNVTSLSLRTSDESDNTQIVLYLASSPHLRVLTLLLLDSGEHHVIDMLFVSTSDRLVPVCPGLTSLCLSECRIKPVMADSLKQVVEAHSLRKIVFVRCHFGSPPNDEEEDHEKWYLYSAMDKDLKVWISQRVESVLVDNDLNLEDEYVYSHYQPLESLTNVPYSAGIKSASAAVLAP
jgi:hypothetical protein